jgi:peptidyl-prolyl cis-trans isomerase C
MTTVVQAQDATEVQAPDATTVVAKVGDTEITLGEMIIARAQLPQQYQQFPADVLFQGVLDQLIQQQLLADTVGDEPMRVALSLANERRSLMAGEAINAINTEAVTEEALQAAYDTTIAAAPAEEEFNAAHLLVATEDEAKAAKARIDAGEAFADVAKEVSSDSSGQNGGNLGWFSAGQMVPEFETAAMALEPGQVSDPVQSQYGWHVISLLEKREKAKPTLDEIRPQLQQQVREAAIMAKLEGLRAAATIELPEDGAFDPALLTDLTLLEPKAE